VQAADNLGEYKIKLSRRHAAEEFFGVVHAYRQSVESQFPLPILHPNIPSQLKATRRMIWLPSVFSIKTTR
jgi:hypothetical protein